MSKIYDHLAESMHLLAHLRGLHAALDYRQMPGRHPAAGIIPLGQERIELVISGRGWVEDGARWVEVVAGDIAWQVAGDRTIGRSDFADPYRCLALSVTVAAGTPRSAPRISRWDDVDDARAFARQVMLHAASEGGDRDALAAWAYARLLYQARLRRDSAVPSPSLRRALALLEARHLDGVTVPELAAAAGWSVNHFHAAFKRQTGVGPHRWLVQRRLRAARDLLAATDQPVATIAIACGFADAAAFCRAFRQEIGIAPGAWRKARLAR